MQAVIFQSTRIKFLTKTPIMCANILNIHPFLWSGTGISPVLCVGPYGLQKESRPRWQKPRLQYPASACHCICSKWQTGSYYDLFFQICKLELLYYLTLVKGFIESDSKILKKKILAALNPASVDLGRLLVSILGYLLIVYSMYFPLLHLSIYLSIVYTFVQFIYHSPFVLHIVHSFYHCFTRSIMFIVHSFILSSICSFYVLCAPFLTLSYCPSSFYSIYCYFVLSFYRFLFLSFCRSIYLSFC